MRHKCLLPCLIVVAVAFGGGCQKTQPAVSQPEPPTQQQPAAQQPTQAEPQPVASGTPGQPVVGGDRDEHGCIGSAGYQWCGAKNKCLRSWEEPCYSKLFPTEKISVLVSDKDPNKYCNGADMDSDGYRKTIKSEKDMTVLATAGTDEERIRFMMSAATGDACGNIWKNVSFKVNNDTVSISQIDGWTGVSIALCQCKPAFEVNLLKLPGIKKVVWE